MLSPRVYLITLIVLLVMCARSLASEVVILDEKPWNSDDLYNALNANLVLNGDFLLGGGLVEGISRGSVHGAKDIPCWDRLDSLANFTLTKHKGLEPRGELYAWYQVSTIKYFSTGIEDQYEVSLLGNFPETDKIDLYAMKCGESCRYERVALTKYPHGLQGALSPAAPGEYIQRFLLGIGGTEWAIKGMHVSQPGLYKRDFIEHRDNLSLGLCEAPKNHLKGKSEWIGYVKIVLVNLIFIGIIILFLSEKDYPYAIIVTCLYVTSGLGLFGLYTGASEVRLGQGVIDRAIISRLATATMIFVISLTLGYWGICRMKEKYNLILRGVKFPVVIPVILYAVLFVVMMNNSFFDAISYYISSQAVGKEGALYISYLRGGISQDTMGLKSHHFRLIFIVIPIVLSLYIIKVSSLQGRWVGSVVMAFLTSLLLILNGEKAPLVWYLVAVLFVLLVGQGHRRMAVLIATIILGSLFALCLPYSQINLMADRAVYGGLTVAYKALELFPHKINYLHGSSISLFGHALDSSYFDLDLLLWRNIFPESYYSGVSGTSTGPVWVQGYVNYGWLGLPIVSFMCGGMIAIYCLIAKSVRPKAVSYAILGWLIFQYSGISESNASKFVADFYSICLLIIVGAYILISMLFGRRG